MARQTSTKRGLQSEGRKRQSSRHGVGAAPATRPVPGASAREENPRRPARRAGTRQVPRGRKRPARELLSTNPATGSLR